MNKLEQQNIIIVVGDLGAGANLIKNTLFLSPDVDFPMPVDERLNYIKNNIYPSLLKNNLSEWITYEYKLRTWQQWYNVDVSDYFSDISTAKVIVKSQNYKIVFITHWPDIANKLKTKYPGIKLVITSSNNKEQLQWQVDTYISKIGIDNLQNFSFPTDIEKNKQQYIDQHGIDAYHKFNILNMTEILERRIIEYKNLPGHHISVGDLGSGNWIVALQNYLNITLNIESCQDLIETWKKLHP